MANESSKRSFTWTASFVWETVLGLYCQGSSSILTVIPTALYPTQKYNITHVDRGKSLEPGRACMGMHAESLQTCSTCFDPMDCSPADSSNPGILQARILEWVAMPFFRGSSPPRDQTWVPHITGGWILYLWANKKALLRIKWTHAKHTEPCVALSLLC